MMPRLRKLRRRCADGMSLVEVMVAVAVGSMVLTSTVVVFIYGLFSFAGMGNYAILTGQSRKSLDEMSRELREATEVVAAQPTGTAKSLTVKSAYSSVTTTYNWDASTGLLSRSRNNGAAEVCLSGCDAWEFTMYQRTPTNGWSFYPTTDYQLCKLINMNWKCSRTILGQRVNTENVVTAQIVLRNKP